jgi:PIN domain nuclease of toxin-antitoxin system
MSVNQSNDSACVIDASALLALLHLETGYKTVEQHLVQSIISSVNWSETLQKAVAKGIKTDGLKEDLEALGLGIVSFTTEDAELAAHLWMQTKSIGLSLGDRACLALGLRLGIPVITADRTWATLAIGVTGQVIR